ncbi:hypothetical protein N9R54_04870 [Pelobium sp.]|nr:hypothetical protein [Pelobium sp.]MDA9555549.1 hypothetical protein [Pelobium sp.]
MKEFILRYISFKSNPTRKREPISTNKVIIGIHDWGGYDLRRVKKIKEKYIECGLSYQLDRFNNYTGKRDLAVNVTISDYEIGLKEKYKYLEVIPVTNVGMDFRGYSKIIELHSNEANSYVLLLNSSVEASQVDFLDDYLNYMDKNPSIGLLGISYSTIFFQTLIRNNFKPHVQSYFLLTTLDVMKEVIKYNGCFPGKNISNKLLLIRYGEVRLSKIIEKLGYDLAIITENGDPFIFPKSSGLFKTKYLKWKMVKGDYRLTTSTPNKINSLNKNHSE